MIQKHPARKGRFGMLLMAAVLGLSLNALFAGTATEHRPLRMVIIGDSTVCYWPPSSPKHGWGMYMQDYFNSKELKVINLARSGRSTKTFIKEGLWAKAMKEKPDFVLIQFGHNDSHSPDHPEATNAKTTYRQYLREYIRDCRSIGAQPVLITPMCRRNFKADGKVKNALLPYANAMKIVAHEMHVPLVDLNTESVELTNRLGEKGSLTLADRPDDHTHFNEKGARTMAGLVMRELPKVEPALKKYEKHG